MRKIKITQFSGRVNAAGDTVLISGVHDKNYHNLTGVALSVPEPETNARVAAIEFDSDSIKVIETGARADVVAFTLNNPPDQRFFDLSKFELLSDGKDFNFAYTDGGEATTYPYDVHVYFRLETNG